MTAVNQSGWKPAAPPAAGGQATTTTGNRALMLEEKLIFEIGDNETTGVDFDPPRDGEGDHAQHGGGGAVPGGGPPPSALRAATSPSRGGFLGGLTRTEPINLPGLSEPETVRHYTRLSRQNYAIDLGLFPLGSCTMKHNPRLEKRPAARFADPSAPPQEPARGLSR